MSLWMEPFPLAKLKLRPGGRVPPHGWRACRRGGRRRAVPAFRVSQRFYSSIVECNIVWDDMIVVG